jgi:hypothetical protein
MPKKTNVIVMPMPESELEPLFFAQQARHASVRTYLRFLRGALDRSGKNLSFCVEDLGILQAIGTSLITTEQMYERAVQQLNSALDRHHGRVVERGTLRLSFIEDQPVVYDHFTNEGLDEHVHHEHIALVVRNRRTYATEWVSKPFYQIFDLTPVDVLGHTTLEFWADRRHAEEVAANDRRVALRGQPELFIEEIDLGSRGVVKRIALRFLMHAPGTARRPTRIGVIALDLELSKRRKAS